MENVLSNSINIRPLTGTLGAEVCGVSLNDGLTPQQLSAVKRAWREHLVLVFRGQFVSPQAQRLFAEQMGTPLNEYPGVEFGDTGLPPGMIRFSNHGKEGVLTEIWHSDGAFLEEPPMGSILAAEHAPEAGGDTMFANMHKAYDALSDGMKKMIEPLTAFVQTVRIPKHYGVGAEAPHAVQPLVRKHADTGRRSLFIGAPEAFRYLVGFTPEESLPLINYLFTHATRPDFCYRHMWRTGDVVMWDNSCTMHHAVHDYGTERRDMVRITLKGTRPQPAQ